MVDKDIDVCHPHKKSDRVLFHKCIFKTEDEARKVLTDRKLAPGEIAVSRYYVNYREEYLGQPSFDGIRMIMAIGGATPITGVDTYFFKDSVEANDDEFVTIAQLKDYLKDYYTKEEVNKLIENIDIDTSIFATKEEVEDIKKKIDDIDSSISNLVTKEDFNNEINKKADASTTYTKEELDYTLNLKADLSEVKNISEKVDSKVDSSYVENYFETNVENVVNQVIKDTNIPAIVEEEIANQNINQQVSDAVDERLKDFDGVTTETIDEALQNNEYFTTNVITPIIQLETTVKELADSSDNVNNIDGGEEWPWYLADASTSIELIDAINSNSGVTLISDIKLNESLIITDDKIAAIDLNDSSISKIGTGATIRVNGGSLLIDGNTGKVDGNNDGEELGDNSAIRCSNGGHIVINGGYFTCGDDGKNLGNSCIYCTEGLVEIYGGTFTQTSENGRIYTLNCQDANYKAGKAKIVVYGGTFLNGYDPADSKSENPAGNFVANGYKSVYNENNNSYIVIPK